MRKIHKFEQDLYSTFLVYSNLRADDADVSKIGNRLILSYTLRRAISVSIYLSIYLSVYVRRISETALTIFKKFRI